MRTSRDVNSSAAAADGILHFWKKDRQQVEQDIVEGRPFRVLDSERGRFDAMLDFLLRSGLWAAATEMRPSGLKKDNGIPYRLLNGVECLREMAGIDTPANCGPLLKDSYNICWSASASPRKSWQAACGTIAP